MSSENNPELFLGLQKDTEIVRKWPIFTATNNLFEQIYSLSHVVGKKSINDSSECSCWLTSQEVVTFLTPFFEDDFRLKWNSRFQDDGVRKILGSVLSRGVGTISREITVDGFLSINIDIISERNQSGRTEMMLIKTDKGKDGDSITIKMTTMNNDFQDPIPGIYGYKAIPEGLNRILENRKKINRYLTASA